MTRFAQRFADLRERNRTGLACFLTAGDPDFDSSLNLLRQLPAHGADIIEIGMPFSDPMADGPAIQASSQRALRNGASMTRTLELLRRLREEDNATPILLMGYYNPILRYGEERFLVEASASGADGLLLVDVPPEESGDLLPRAKQRGIDLIRLATPTTDAARLPAILDGAGGFLYYVSVAGITGTKSPQLAETRAALAELRRHCKLPIAVGFGIRSTEQARLLRDAADALVVGSALVERAADTSRHADLLGFVSQLADAVHAPAEGNTP